MVLGLPDAFRRALWESEGMIWEDLSYLGVVTLAGGVARALRRGLPEGWRIRLEACPPEDLPAGWIWLHAVSVGELMLAEGILGWLRDQGYITHVTTGTPAGLQLLRKRLPTWNHGTTQITGGAFPLDDPAGLRSFLNPAPGAFIALETELWPNLMRVLAERGIPRVIVNGRLTGRSLDRGGVWLRTAAGRLTAVAARDEVSAEAFESLGAPRVALGGNLKADLPPPSPLHGGWEPLRRAWAKAQVLVAGNTVEGEEDLLVGVWSRIRERHPDLRMILAPRQPKRFQEVATRFKHQGLRFRRASSVWPQDEEPWTACDILLLDTLGELPSAYREGTLALVGGGWQWHGGHNPLESVRWGIPTLVGPGYGNFEDLVTPLRDAGLLKIVETKDLEAAIFSTLEQAPLRPGQAPVELPMALRGALGRTCGILKAVLSAHSLECCR
jgi:3-deoxy-D-manno-octulosonic-acid transferase